MARNTFDAKKLAAQLLADYESDTERAGFPIAFATRLEKAGIAGQAGGKHVAAENVEAVAAAWAGKKDIASRIRLIAYFHKNDVERALETVKTVKGKAGLTLNNVPTVLSILSAARKAGDFDVDKAANNYLNAKIRDAETARRNAETKKALPDHHRRAVDIRLLAEKIADPKLANAKDARDLMRVDERVRKARDVALDAIAAFAKAVYEHGARADETVEGEQAGGDTVARILAELNGGEATKH